ncbi:A-kinase anchor protein 1, mitochondrial-like isoform X2 [Branchiostoma floridae]|uniref:A-kinase anchor protein 1, mitochondrial-like isoform X2 n=1 Tax=Branchiostoma floridae TaxID=7739 RepID=A0A9J7N5K7_BRAFL|nr:A-kinase anchor protein 1, mitochondrial-like isoform X2 [Branchiostoma floridae]
MTCSRIVMTAGISVAVAVFTILWFSSKKKKKPSTKSTSGSDKHSSSSIEKEESSQATSSIDEQFSHKHAALAVEELSANTFSAKDFNTTTAPSESSLSLKKEAPLPHVESCKQPELLNSAEGEKFEQEEHEDAPLQNEQNEMAAIKSPDVGKSDKSSVEEASTKQEQALCKAENTTTDNTDESTCKDELCVDCEENVKVDYSDKQEPSPPISSAVPSKTLSNAGDNLNCGSELKIEESSSDTLLQPQVTSIEAEKVSKSVEPTQESSSCQLESPNTQEADRVQTSSQASSSSSLSESSTDGPAEDETSVGKDVSCDACSDEGIADTTNSDVTAESTHSSGAEVQSVPSSDWGTAVEELERKTKQKTQSPKTHKPPSEADTQKSPSPTPVDIPLVSPGSEVSSEVSNDSGRSTMDNGAASTASSSTHQDQAGVLEEDQIILWKINFPSDLCGRLIGKQGRNIKWMMERTGCNIYIRKSPDYMQWCCLEGTQSEVDHALDIIGRKFPTVDLSAVQDSPVSDSSDISQLQLTEGLNDVIVCNIMDASHVFVQQHIHPTFPALATLDHCMAICYADQTLVPGVPKPVDIGVICVAPSPMLGAYCRAEVREVMEDTDSVVVKFCDYGGYYHVPRDVLRQIRSDFMTLPFQAVECYMANIAPLEGEESFSIEATGLVEELTQGMVTQVNVVGYSTEGCPLVHLYSTQGDTSIMVNRVMVEQGLAQWLEA